MRKLVRRDRGLLSNDPADHVLVDFKNLPADPSCGSTIHELMLLHIETCPGLLMLR